MPDYQKGKVYRILQDNGKTVYIGSTTQDLSARMASHRKNVKCHPERKLSTVMAEVGVGHFSIELIVDCPCDRREILNRAEGEQIRLHDTIADGCNMAIAGRTHAEYWQTVYKAKYIANCQTPMFKAKDAERRKTPKYVDKRVAYQQTPQCKAKRIEREKTPEFKAKRAEYNRQYKLQRKNAAAIGEPGPVE